MTGTPQRDEWRSREVQDVPSPCTNVCRMNAQSGLCEGCFRTLDEIASWSGATPEEKRAVRAKCDARKARGAA